MSSVTFTLTFDSLDLAMLSDYIREQGIRDSRGKLLSNRQAIYSIVKSFIDEIDRVERSDSFIDDLDTGDSSSGDPRP